jgi:hypothetical protein
MVSGCSVNGEARNMLNILSQNIHGKRPRKRVRYRWENKSKMHISEICCGTVNVTKLAHDDGQ